MLSKVFNSENKLRHGTFGVHILNLASKWESDFKENLAAGKPVVEVYTRFAERLKWLQHERLVHLLVLMTTVIAMLFSFGTALYLTELALVWVLSMILMMLTVAYTIHYFKLENLVQHWYLIESEILGFSGKDE